MIESDAVESMALAGGLAAIMATLELVLSATILGLGAGGFIDVLLLVGWVVMTDVLLRRLHRPPQSMDLAAPADDK